MKSRKFIIPLIVTTALVLGACGTKEEKKTEQSSTQKTVSIADGVKEMKQTLQDLKANLQTKDAEKTKEDGNKLEESWQKFEDGVKEKNADLYEKVETPLHTIEAGVKVQPLDVQTLDKAAGELDNVLTEVGKMK
ncbi:hypothetical protein ACFDTO_22605 [Microbacteriaceae bacterium 4G12]